MISFSFYLKICEKNDFYKYVARQRDQRTDRRTYLQAYSHVLKSRLHATINRLHDASAKRHTVGLLLLVS